MFYHLSRYKYNWKFSKRFDFLPEKSKLFFAGMTKSTRTSLSVSKFFD